MVAGMGAVGLLLVVFWPRSPYEQRWLLGRSHFAEIGKGLTGLKPQILKGLEGMYDPRQPPDHFVTSEGVVLAYSVSPKGDGFGHHISLSYQRGRLPRSVATAVFGFVIDRSGFEPDRFRVFDTVSGVVHASFRASAEEQKAWKARVTEEPKGPELRAAITRAMHNGETLLARIERGLNPYDSRIPRPS